MRTLPVSLAGMALKLVVIGLCVCTSSLAVPAAPGELEVEQPDGTRLRIQLRGDEYLHWHEDAAGYPVTRHEKTRAWHYAFLRGGRIEATPYVAGEPMRAARLGIQRLDSEQLREARKEALDRRKMAAPDGDSTAAAGTDSPARTITSGTLQNLVLLVDFPDLSAPFPAADYGRLFNTIGYTDDGAVGSVKDYYLEVSNGALTIQSTVVEWITADNNFAHYGENVNGEDIRPRELVAEALAKLEARGFDFRQVDGDSDGYIDGLTVIHAGGGEEFTGNNSDYIWSHKWALQSQVTYDGVRMQLYNINHGRRGWDSQPTSQGITRIGVISHETGHFLGLPDLYDTDGTSSGAGAFCLMAGGSWNGNNGTSPAHMSAWCKQLLGWITVQPITVANTYSLADVTDSQRCFKLKGGLSGSEYFLIENRFGGGFDAGLPGSIRGLLIWHIDDSLTDNRNENHYWVDLEEADGPQDLQSGDNNGNDNDYWRAGNATEFSSTTTPSSNGYDGAPLGLIVSSIGTAGPTMSLTISSDVTVYDYTVSTVGANQTAGVPFPVTITALGFDGQLLSNYQQAADDPALPDLSLRERTERTVGVYGGLPHYYYPLDTLYEDARTQVIYTSEQIGAAGPMTGLALHVTLVPSQPLENWTIRIKHTDKTGYGDSAAWENSGWTTVLSTNSTTITSTGWIWFDFTTPFSYDGTSNLMVDFSFNADSFTNSGNVAVFATPENRGLSASSDSLHGDPLTWNTIEDNDTTTVDTKVPLLMLEFSSLVAAGISAGSGFVDGIWRATITPEAGGSGVVVSVFDEENDLTARSNAFNIAVNPVMQVSGNGTTIVKGDTTPSADDHTDFGSAGILTGSVARTFTIANNGYGDLVLSGNPPVAVSGTHAGDFAVTSAPLSPVAGQTSTTFTLVFDPSGTGTRNASLSIANNAPGSPFTFAIRGEGSAEVAGVTINDVAADEGDNAIFTVELSAAPLSTVTVDYTTEDGTALGGSDYTATSGSLSFPAGQRTRTITVPTTDDALLEESETFTVRLTAATNAVIVDATGTGTIINTDVPALFLALAPSTISESAGSGASIGTVSRNHTAGSLAVALTGSDESEAIVPAGVTIPDGQSTATFAIDAVDDDDQDGTISVTIAATAAAHAGAMTVLRVTSDEHVTNVVYTYTVRGMRYGNGSVAVSGSGYCIVDLTTGLATTLVAYTDGSSDIRDWDSGGLWYIGDIGASDYWFLTTEPNYGAAPSTASAFGYRQLYGSIHPSIVPLGGQMEGFVCAALSGVGRSGQTAAGTTFETVTLTARIDLPLTRSYNDAFSSHATVVSALATNAGITSASSTVADLVSPDVAPAAADAKALYSLSLNGLNAGNGSVLSHARNGYLILDYAAKEARMILNWRQGSTNYYSVTELMVGSTFQYTLPLGPGYQFFGAVETEEDTRGFWLAYGSNMSHELGTGVMQTVPFSFTGERWSHVAEPGINGQRSGDYTQETFRASIHIGTLTLNGQGMSMDDAQDYVIQTLLPPNSQLQTE